MGCCCGVLDSLFEVRFLRLELKHEKLHGSCRERMLLLLLFLFLLLLL
jgi:hypothetical protein